jgi:two-component system NtrC family sensor kinase
MRVETVLAEEPVTVVGAREQLIQVLIALVLNAADAMEGGGTIRIRVAREGEGAALLEVADRGRGIPPNERSRVFEPFYTTKPAGSGTGLGLSICYGIVAEHRGRIELDSEVGRGSTFRVVLPTGEES